MPIYYLHLVTPAVYHPPLSLPVFVEPELIGSEVQREREERAMGREERERVREREEIDKMREREVGERMEREMRRMVRRRRRRDLSYEECTSMRGSGSGSGNGIGNGVVKPRWGLKVEGGKECREVKRRGRMKLVRELAEEWELPVP